MIIIMRFGKNVLCPKYIDICEFRRVRVGRTWSAAHFLFIIQKSGKVQEHDLYLIKFYIILIFFSGMNNKNFSKKGASGGPNKLSVVVLIDFIAILLTPGIFLIQIVNTNIYLIQLIHFYNTNNIKMYFPKS